jgi:hypothetical protein
MRNLLVTNEIACIVSHIAGLTAGKMRKVDGRFTFRSACISRRTQDKTMKDAATCL